ncbi:hypothetical protein T484DRAFT_1984988 [Baffinella frigidus]|nr:hypothetical protein T484DRAFT_1984988 [Cryptophyta sp. CCMP2293]
MPSSMQVLMFWNASAIASCFLLWSSKTARCRAGDVSSWSRHLRFAPLTVCAASSWVGSMRCAEPLPALPEEASLPSADPPPSSTPLRLAAPLSSSRPPSQPDISRFSSALSPLSAPRGAVTRRAARGHRGELDRQPSPGGDGRGRAG